MFPDFGKGKLHWEDDIEMLSHFLDRKEELKEDHVNYMKRHPELKAILGDFLQVMHPHLVTFNSRVGLMEGGCAVT